LNKDLLRNMRPTSSFSRTNWLSISQRRARRVRKEERRKRRSDENSNKYKNIINRLRF